MLPQGRSFYKMTGSGNDFVMLDAMRDPVGDLADPASVASICARGTGIGADGLVWIEPSIGANFRMIYLNSDGSRAELCGNASLCSARLAVELGIVKGGEFRVETDAGVLGARMTGEVPEIDLPEVVHVRSRLPFRLAKEETWIGFVVAGVPHLTVLVEDASSIDVVGRGRPLRYDSSLGQGANVNFVSPLAGGDWAIRTYERGVEGETLACGTGATASAILLAEAGLTEDKAAFRTESGEILRVRLTRAGSAWKPSLSGEARLVYRGVLGELKRTPLRGRE